MLVKAMVLSTFICYSAISIMATSYKCETSLFSESEMELCNYLKSKKINKKYNVDLLKLNQGKIDGVTLRLFKPKLLNKHKSSEKKANNTLIKHVKKIKDHINEYITVYKDAEKSYSVNKEIIAAILTKETWLGKIKPKHDAYSVFYSLYTKVKADTKRNKWLKNMGKKNIYYISQYCQKHKISLEKCNFKASYAGAVGFPQFMPMNFWLMKGYNNNKPNLNYMPDAIMSVANFLNFNTFKEKIDYKRFSILQKLEEAWYNTSFKSKKQHYFTNKKKLLSYNMNETYLKSIGLSSQDKEEILYINKYIAKILRYNNSMNYAFGVLRISYEVNK